MLTRGIAVCMALIALPLAESAKDLGEGLIGSVREVARRVLEVVAGLG